MKVIEGTFYNTSKFLSNPLRHLGFKLQTFAPDKLSPNLPSKGETHTDSLIKQANIQVDNFEHSLL